MHTTLHTDSFSNLPRVEVAPLKATVTMPGMVRSTEEVDIKGRQALMSEDGKCFGVHSTGYKVVQHEDLFNRFKEYLLDRIRRVRRRLQAEGYGVSRWRSRLCCLGIPKTCL